MPLQLHRIAAASARNLRLGLQGISVQRASSTVASDSKKMKDTETGGKGELLTKALVYGGIGHMGQHAPGFIRNINKIPVEWAREKAIDAASKIAVPVSDYFIAGNNIPSGVATMVVMGMGGRRAIADYAEFEFLEDKPSEVYRNVVAKSKELIGALASSFKSQAEDNGRIPVDLAVKIISHGQISAAENVQKKLLDFGNSVVLDQTDSQAFIASLGAVDQEAYQQLYSNIQEVVSYAKKNKICVVIDKEQHRFNRFIDFVTAELVRDGHIGDLMLTVQGGYADAEAERKPLLDIANLCQKLGTRCSAKVVGCAYIEEEREYANAHDGEDPTASSEDATHEFWRGHFSELFKSEKFYELVAATHRPDNVTHAYQLTQDYSDNPTLVSRATLKGMEVRDIDPNHPAMSLLSREYAPISGNPLDPYLIRRLIENTGDTAVAVASRAFKDLTTVVCHEAVVAMDYLTDHLGLTPDSSYKQR